MQAFKLQHLRAVQYLQFHPVSRTRSSLIAKKKKEEISSHVVVMLVRTAKKTSKFEDSDSNVMSKPARAVFEMPQRSSPRVPLRLKTTTPAAVAGYEHHRALIAGGKGTSPRSPLNEARIL
ncbi:hypothetical protein ABZP36_013211 [Zizania latifolia]